MLFRISAALLSICLVCGVASNCRAGMITFDLTSVGGFVGADPSDPTAKHIFTGNYVGLTADGVSFEADLVGTGFRNQLRSDVTQVGSTGLGVAGGTNLLNQNEAIRFDLSISGVTGGSLVFDGFTRLDFSEYQSGNDSVVVSTGDPVTAGNTLAELNPADGPNNTGVSTFSAAPNGIFVSGRNAGGNASLRLFSITASFTGTAAAVPEPSSLTLMMFGGLFFFRRRRAVQR